MASRPFTFKFLTENSSTVGSSSSTTGASQIAWPRTNPTPIPPPNYTTFLTRNQIQPSGPGSTAASVGLRPASTPQYNANGALCVYSSSQYAFRPRKRMDKHLARKLPAAQRASYRASYEVPPVVQNPHWSSVDTEPDTQMQVQSTFDGPRQDRQSTYTDLPSQSTYTATTCDPTDPPTYTATTCDPKLTYNDPMQYQDQDREQDSRLVHREHSYSDSEDDVDDSNADAEGDPERDTSSSERESFICRYNTSCMRTSMLDSEFVQGSSTQASSSSSLKIRIPPRPLSLPRRSPPITITSASTSQPSEAGLAELEARLANLLTNDEKLERDQGKNSRSVKSPLGTSMEEDPLFSLSRLCSISTSSPVDGGAQRAPKFSFSFPVPFALGGKEKEKNKSIAGAQRANINTSASSVFGSARARFDPWNILPTTSPSSSSSLQFSNQVFAPHSKPQVHSSTILPTSTSPSTPALTSTPTPTSPSTSTSTKRKRDRSDEGEHDAFEEEEEVDVPGHVPAKSVTSQKEVVSDNKTAGGTGAGGDFFKFEFTHPLPKPQPSSSKSESCALDQAVEVETPSKPVSATGSSQNSSSSALVLSSTSYTDVTAEERGPHSQPPPPTTSTSTSTKRKRDRSDEGEAVGDEEVVVDVSGDVQTATSQTDKKDASVAYKFEFTHPLPTPTISEPTLGPVKQAVEGEPSKPVSESSSQNSSSSKLEPSATSVDGTAEEMVSGGTVVGSSTHSEGSAAGVGAELQARSLATPPSSPQVDHNPVHNAATPVTNPNPPQVLEPTLSSPSTASLTSADSNSGLADSTSSDSANFHVTQAQVPQPIQQPVVAPTLSSPSTAGLTSTHSNSGSGASSANFHVTQALDASLRDFKFKFVPIIPAASASIETSSAFLSDQLQAPVASQPYPPPLTLHYGQLPPRLDNSAVQPSVGDIGLGLGLGGISSVKHDQYPIPSFTCAVQQGLTGSVDALGLPPAYADIYPQAQMTYTNFGLENSFPQATSQPQWPAIPTVHPTEVSNQMNQPQFCSNPLPDVQPQSTKDTLPSLPPTTYTPVSIPPVSDLNIPPSPKMNPRPRYSPYNFPKPPKFSAYFHPWMRNDPTLGRLWGFDRFPERDRSFTRPIYISYRPVDLSLRWTLSGNIKGKKYGCLSLYSEDGDDESDDSGDSGDSDDSDDSTDSDDSESEPEEVPVTKKRRTTQIKFAESTSRRGKRRLEEDDALERSPEKRRKGDPTPPLKSILPHSKDQVVESNRLKRSREEDDRDETDSDSDDSDVRSPSPPLSKKARTEDILESPTREKRQLEDDDEESSDSDVSSSGAVKKRKIVDGYIPTKSLPGTFISDPTPTLSFNIRPTPSSTGAVKKHMVVDVYIPTKSLPGTFISDPTPTSSSNIRRTPRRKSPSPAVLHRKPSRKFRVWKAVKNVFQSFWA